MWYIFGFLYFAMGLTIGVVELRTRQKYEPADSNRSWWVLPGKPILLATAINNNNNSSYYREN